MTKTFCADVVFPIDRAPIKNGVVVVNDAGVIIEIGEKQDYSESELIVVEGGICPGFINTHCHLELSFMFGEIPERTGLIEFVSQVVAIRDNYTEAQEQAAIQKAADAMWANGIVAVGDISNDTRSFAVKGTSPLRFHTFVEVFDLSPVNTAASKENGSAVFLQAPTTNGSTASITPHAPYSCTPELYKFADEVSAQQGAGILSIHNQENIEENDLFINKTGIWAELPEKWGFPFDWFEPYGKNSLPAMSPHLTHDNQMIFVHNTFTSTEDVKWAHGYFSEVFWATCANANLYIEDRVPDYARLLAGGAVMTIGTDSLASNWQLCILEEIKSIRKHYPKATTAELLKWGTLNGARALKYDQNLGSLTPGKSPGLIHLSNLNSDFELTEKSEAKRL